MTANWQLAARRNALYQRARIIQAIRLFFTDRGYLEAETPHRIPAPAPESHIDAVPSGKWFLHPSPELCMKRMVAAGYEKIFQICRCWREGERGSQHLPEFTLLEWYCAGADYMQMVHDTEQLVTTLAGKLGSGLVIEYRGQKIDLTPPWPKIAVRDAFLKYAGWDPAADPDPLRFDIDLVSKVIPSFAPDRPTVIYDYPAAMASLARLKADNPSLAERTEIFIGGLEIANAYSELVDWREQRKRFTIEIEKIESERKQGFPMPERFLRAVERLPVCGGIALGMDRLVMLFCDADSIDEVVAFTSDTA